MTNHIKIYGVKPRIQYVADGNLTTYEFPFAIFKASDINVYFNDKLQETSAYSVSIGEGSVTFESAPASGIIITILRNLSIERTSDFQDSGTLRAKVLNDEFDYQIACQQQIADNLNRSMVLPPYATDTDVDLTLPTPCAGKAIVWNKDGTNLENSTVEVNALENTIKGYKESAESAASTATEKATLASDKADIATAQADIATEKAAETSTMLSTKANKDMNNLSALGKSSIVELSMPSINSIDLVLGNSGSQYTAPANGYYYLEKVAGNNLCYLGLYNETRGYGVSSDLYAGTSTFREFLPVSKDDVINVFYSATGSTTVFKFIYAEGEV